MATRREKVILELQDDFTAEMLKAAGATAALNRELNQLDRQSTVFERNARVVVRGNESIGSSARRASVDIDSMSGRVSILADLLLAFGPAAVPIGAVAIPAVTALTSVLGTTVLAAGTTALAFGGVGDALEAMNKAHLEPTKENLKEAEEALKRLAPAAQDFVNKLDSLRGLGAQLRDAGAQSLFPGLVDALDSLETRGPDAVRVIEALNREVGDIARDSAADLASKRWDDFFKLLEREGPRTLDTFASSMGNVIHGLSEILEAFAPLNRDGLSWFEGLTADFDKWATELKKTDGFKEFVAYVRENGPQVADTIAALADALAAIATALADVGPHSLQAIEGIASAVAAIASSDMAGPLLAAIAAMRIINRLAPITAGSLALLGGGAAGGAAGKGGKGGRRFPGGRGGAAAAGILGIGAVDQILEGNSIVDWFGKSGSAAGEAIGADKLPGALKAKLDVIFNVDANTVPAENKIDALKVEVKRLNRLTGKPKIDIADEEAKRKEREQDDWIFQWGRKNAKAQARLDNRQAKAAGDDISRWLNGYDGSTGTATARLNDQASGAIAGVAGALASLNGRTATTYIRTIRLGAAGGALLGATGSADGGTVPKTGLHYADRHPYMLADGEEVISNRHGQADRHRALLKAINAGRLANGGTAGNAPVHIPAPRMSLAGARFVLEVPGMGQMTTRIVRAEMDAQDRWEGGLDR